MRMVRCCRLPLRVSRRVFVRDRARSQELLAYGANARGTRVSFQEIAAIAATSARSLARSLRNRVAPPNIRV